MRSLMTEWMRWKYDEKKAAIAGNVKEASACAANADDVREELWNAGCTVADEPPGLILIDGGKLK